MDDVKSEQYYKQEKEKYLSKYKNIDSQDVEDMLQEAFEKAYPAFEKTFDSSKGSEAAYFNTIVHNTFEDLRRKMVKYKRRWIDLGEDFDPVCPVNENLGSPVQRILDAWDKEDTALNDQSMLASPRFARLLLKWGAWSSNQVLTEKKLIAMLNNRPGGFKLSGPLLATPLSVLRIRVWLACSPAFHNTSPE